MRRLLLAVGLLAFLPLLACGPSGPADAGYVDAGIKCSVASDCPKLRCLPDGGIAPEDAGSGATMQACIFNRCAESCL